MRDHLLLASIYALAIAVFFGTLWKDTPRERVRHGAAIFGGLMIGALIVAWLMSRAN